MGICIAVESGKVSGYARIYGGQDPFFDPANVWVQQCRGDGTACGTRAQAKRSGANIASTSSKPAAFGHAYRACTRTHRRQPPSRPLRRML